VIVPVGELPPLKTAVSAILQVGVVAVKAQPVLGDAVVTMLGWAGGVGVGGVGVGGVGVGGVGGVGVGGVTVTCSAGWLQPSVTGTLFASPL
jgi:hypothetical protein